MTTYKVHIPGESVNDIQRCVRCHAQLNYDSSTNWKPCVWRAGVPVASDGRGNMTVRIPKGARDCGRKVK